MSRVIPLPRRAKPAPKPVFTVYETVTSEERAAADELLRKAQAIHRLLNASFATSATLATAPRLIAEAKAAISTLEELL